MASYIEYKLEDGTTVLIEAEEPVGGLAPAGRSAEGVAKVQAKRTFEEALQGIKPWARTLRQQLENLAADEVEVTFGIKAVGEAGIFAVGKIGAEANYKVTLKWSEK